MKHATIYITGLAGLLLSATAMADNTVIYGKINLALETVSAKGATDGHSNIPSGQRVTSNLSYLGFRGEENRVMVPAPCGRWSRTSTLTIATTAALPTGPHLSA
ncbi:hypothetical protein [Paludibacterium denitrificans]|uniref:hypothetical protein n=1 Tax=Paludibacterium denitrificans TaxID=2675226 RepID=UPI001E362E48|nr:hypothetical protein [Paludibacterium denitrificans]